MKINKNSLEKQQKHQKDIPNKIYLLHLLQPYQHKRYFKDPHQSNQTRIKDYLEGKLIHKLQVYNHRHNKQIIC